MKYAAASDTVIYNKKHQMVSAWRWGGEGSLTAIHRKIKASIENVNDAASHADIRKMTK